MSTEIVRSGNQIFVGDFVGSCSDSPNRAYTIGWYCSKSRGRMDSKNFVLMKGTDPIVWGEVTLRIYEGKASDAGRFALHLIGKTNQSTLRLYEANGQELGSRQFREGLQFFDLSADGQFYFWNSTEELRCMDLSTMQEVFGFQLEPRFHATAAQLDCDGTTVILQHNNKGWYRFDRSGRFLEKEKWLGDYIQDCDGPSLYQIISDLYRNQGIKDADEAKTYAEWIEEALRRGIKDSYHLKLSSVYHFLAQLYTDAGEPEKANQAKENVEQHLDGFILVDRVISQLEHIGSPPNREMIEHFLSDLERATKTERLLEYPNYMAKLYRTKGELLERLEDKDGAIKAYQTALEANPQAGCKKHLERLTNAPVVLPEKPKNKPVEERIVLEKLTMFHFRCPVCGATLKEKGILEFLDDWHNSDAGRLEQLFAVLLEATKELKLSRANSTKRFHTAADNLILALSVRGKDAAPGSSPLLISAAEKTMVIQTQCPVCLKPPGFRRKDNYFTVWSEACRVQSSNLFYEIGAILMGLCSLSPVWLDSELQQRTNAIRSNVFRAGEAVGLMSCPRCGRFTSCLYGGTRSDPESGMCRWCSDTNGANQISITINVSDVVKAIDQSGES